jgi:hypothetical protein
MSAVIFFAGTNILFIVKGIRRVILRIWLTAASTAAKLRNAHLASHLRISVLFDFGHPQISRIFLEES